MEVPNLARCGPTREPREPVVASETGEEGGGEKVYVAVGKSLEKALRLLRWTFKRFGKSREICILHVFQPSPLIPTLCNSLSLPDSLI